MLKYLKEYESVSEAKVKTLRLILGFNCCLLKMLLVFAKLALLVRV